MWGHDDILECNACGEKWVMDGYGRLNKDCSYVHIPDWYRWERAEAEREIYDGYHAEFGVRVEALPNEKGFVKLGIGTLRLISFSCTADVFYEKTLPKQIGRVF